MQTRTDRKGIEILVVDADPTVQGGLKTLLTDQGLVVTTTGNVTEALELVQVKFFAVALCDLDTPSSEAGLKVVQSIRESSPATTTIVLSPRKAYDAAVAAHRAGAADIVVKSPDQVEYLLERVSAAAKEWARERDRDALMLEVQDVHEEFLRRMREMYRTVIDFQDRLQGRDILADFQLPECRVLVVDDDAALPTALQEAFKRRDDGWVFSTVQSGGEALDLGGREKYHVALIKSGLPDLPGSMVISTLRAQSPETIYLQYGVPGTPRARVEIKDGDRDVVIIPEFTEAAQLAGRLDEIRSAFKVKAKERRYLQSFRTAQFDFLKKYAELKKAIETARAEMDPRQLG